MRQQLMQIFTEIYILNLHGSTKKRETAPDSLLDENVFDIQQGVGIGIFVKQPVKTELVKIYHADLWGSREQKYEQLLEKNIESTTWELLSPQSPFYLFMPQNVDLLSEYQQGWKITEVMPINVLGFQTHRDKFAVDFDYEKLYQRIQEMRDPHLTDDVFRQKYELRDNRDWQLTKARLDLRHLKNWESDLIKCNYRPFDWRYCYFSEIAADYPRRELKDHVVGKENFCLNTVRQTKATAWRHAVVSDAPAPAVFVEIKDGSSVFPLYLYPTNDITHQQTLLEISPWSPGENNRAPNLNPNFVANLEEYLGLTFISDGIGDLATTFGPEDILHYIYAIFHSPTYRERYAEFLKIDFPRVPLTSNVDLFRTLCGLGNELVGLHLLESPAVNNFITRYPATGDNLVDKGYPLYVAPAETEPGRIKINKDQYFEGVPPEVWNFQIGGYQVCDKWLKDRRGRRLSYDNLTHYQQIIVALKETIRLMTEIDEAIPGWPLEQQNGQTGQAVVKG